MTDFSDLDARFMALALEEARRAASLGEVPVGAVIVRDDQVIALECNRQLTLNDPTAHAEVEAIRDACRTHGATHLRGATLLASGEPCAMCYMSALYAGISQVFFAADRDEVAAHGFDYRGAYHVFADDPQTWRSPAVAKFPVSGGLRPFTEFRARLRQP